MPVAGNSPLQRAQAHLDWSSRYTRYGDTNKAGAHFGRALAYFGGRAPSPKRNPKRTPRNAPIPSDAHCNICFQRPEPGTKMRRYDALTCRCDGKDNWAHEDCFTHGAIVECDQCRNLKRIRPVTLAPPQMQCDLCTEMDDPDYPLRQYPDHTCRCYPNRGWIHERCHERSKPVTCSLCKESYRIQDRKKEAAFEADLNRRLGIS